MVSRRDQEIEPEDQGTERHDHGLREGKAGEGGKDSTTGESNPNPPIQFTTVVKDIYGRYYDLRYEHPSWEQHKKGSERCIARDAFYCTLEEADRLTKRKK